MKGFTCLIVLVSLFGSARSQTSKTVSLIPQPVSLKVNTGNFLLKRTTQLLINTNNTDAMNVVDQFSKKVAVATGYSLSTGKESNINKIGGIIHFNIIKNSSLGNEGYRVNSNADAITVEANTAAGLYYGMQTLIQLLPKEIESKTKIENTSWLIPAVEIEDYPAFAWRGMMLDVSRHFFTKQQVEEFIDEIVKYKFNVLHLHLTDDQGWRIEIKSFPNLTKVGAWRPKREGAWANAKAPDPSEPKTYGGFYTQDDIREIVRYAKERFVSVLPEIDIPAHSMAAIASYPELSCTPGTYYVNAGEEFQQWGSNGNVTLIDNTLCPANEKVYDFLDKVFTEVAALFPFGYIHVGGDEAAKNFWEKSDAVKELAKKEGLKNMEEVQSYFIRRVEKIIQSKGKKLIGWDEILEGGLAPNATVMSWRGMKGGIAAAKMGHHVVMSPMDFTYVDLMQGDPYVEPPEFESLRLKQSYKFNPVPPDVDRTLILGGEGNLWTEHTTNMRAAQYLLWPRTLAIAESVWSPQNKKDWNNFVNRVEGQFQRMDVARIKYARSMYDPTFTPSIDNMGKLQLKMETEVPDLHIYYSFDETNPDEFYPEYKEPVVVPPDALHVKVITYRNNKPIGKQINMPVEELMKRTKKG